MEQTPVIFVPYKDKSSARRGLQRAATALENTDVALNPENYLHKAEDGKWGFYKRGDTFLLPSELPKEEAKEAETFDTRMDDRLAKAFQGAQAAAGVQVSSIAEIKEGFSNLKVSDPFGILAQDQADEQQDLQAAIERGIKQGESEDELPEDDDDETPPPAPDAFSNFALNQLGARPEAPANAASPAPQPVIKLERSQQPEKNGVKRPHAGTICDVVWATADAFYNETASVPAMKKVLEAAMAKGVNQFTARTQYARWRTFNGIVGRTIRA